jgi:hypothetical protein
MVRGFVPGVKVLQSMESNCSCSCASLASISAMDAATYGLSCT